MSSPSMRSLKPQAGCSGKGRPEGRAMWLPSALLLLCVPGERGWAWTQEVRPGTSGREKVVMRRRRNKTISKKGKVCTQNPGAPQVLTGIG